MKKILFAALFLMPSVVRANDLITSTLLDHVMTVTHFKSSETKLALVDSVVQIGKYKENSIFDLQAGFNAETKPDAGEANGANFLIGGFFKISSLIKDKPHFPDQWKFLNSLEHGVAYFYDFREKRDYVCYQVGFAFQLSPRSN